MDLTVRIDKARLESQQLYSQIDKIKSKIKDSSLVDCSIQIPSLNKSQLNLKTNQILKGHNNKIIDFKWCKDSNSILSCSQDGFLIIWDPKTGLKLNAIPLDSQWTLTCGYSPNGKLVASAGLTNNCTVYSIPSDFSMQQQILTIFKGHVCGITQCEFINNELILTASGDMTCALWNIAKSKKVDEYIDHFGDVLSLDVNLTNENIFISGSSDGYARVWDKRTSKVQQSFFVGSDITSLKFFPNGDSFVSGSDDGIVRLFDLRSDCLLMDYSLPNQTKYGTNQQVLDSNLDSSGITSLDFSSSGRLMYSCYSEHGCIIWDFLKNEIVGKLDGHSNRVSTVRSSPNGYGVCTSSWDTTMRVWTPSYA